MHTLLDERDKVEIESQIQKISNNSIVSKKAGSSIVVNDSAGNKPRGLRVFGKTEQKSFAGNQLLQNSNSESKGGVVVTIIDEFNKKVNGTATENLWINLYKAELESGETYTLSINSSLQISIWDKTASNTILTKLAGIETVTFTAANSGIYVFVLSNSKGTVFNNVIADAMLNKGSSPLPYEPYIGCIPSPNPEYPQELISAGDSGNVEVGLYVENLFDPDMGGYMSNPNGDITIVTSKDVVAMSKYIPTKDLVTAIIKDYDSTNKESYAYRIAWYDSDKKWIKTTILVASKTTLSAPTNAKYFRASAGYHDTLMICYRDADTYEPCVKQSLTISTPNGLPGILVTDASLATYTDADGNMLCADEVDFERGVYIKRISTYRFDETDKDYVKIATSSAGNTFTLGNQILAKMEKIINNNNSVIIVSNIAKGISSNGRGNKDFFNIYCIDGDVIYFRDAVSNTFTLDDIKAILTDAYISFILSEPIETPLSEEEIAQYKALTMNYPTTTILNDSNAHMEVSYVANTQNHIEQNYLTKDEFESLKTRISSIAKNII